MSLEGKVNVLNSAKYEEIKCFVFFDIEATGLLEEENYRTKITEISLVACSTPHLMATKLGELPRVLHKLTLCINPFKRISYKAEEITGLSNDLLEHEQKFDKNTAETISHFLSHLQKPYVLVAHNGLQFDFPVLKRLLDMVESKLPEDLLVADSLIIFREINEIEELLLAETSVRPLSPPPETTHKENNTDKNKTEDEILDDYIKKELLEIAPEYEHNQSQKTPDVGPPNVRQLRELNETTPVKQIYKIHNIPPKKLPYSNVNEITPSSSTNLSETFNLNKKRLRDIPPKSRRDLFGAKKVFNLNQIYQRCFNEPPQQSHYAEGDVITLLKCAIAKKEDFIRITQEQAIFFTEIKALGK